MVFVKKDVACQKNGKVKKGYRMIQTSGGSVRYMTDPVKRPNNKVVIEKPKVEIKAKKQKKKVKIEEPKDLTLTETCD